MFELDWGKLVVIGIVALIVIGPKELPAVLRTLGQWVTKIRRMASEFQGQFQEAMREAEIADLKQQVDTMSGDLTHGLTDTPSDTAHHEPEHIAEVSAAAASADVPVQSAESHAAPEPQSTSAEPSPPHATPSAGGQAA
jgi:sec-independent protein translocase protein TatB